MPQVRNQGNPIKIRHTASANERLKQAQQLMGITNKLANELEETFNDWYSLPWHQTKKYWKTCKQASMEIPEGLTRLFRAL